MKYKKNELLEIIESIFILRIVVLFIFIILFFEKKKEVVIIVNYSNSSTVKIVDDIHSPGCPSTDDDHHNIYGMNENIVKRFINLYIRSTSNLYTYYTRAYSIHHSTWQTKVKVKQNQIMSN